MARSFSQKSDSSASSRQSTQRRSPTDRRTQAASSRRSAAQGSASTKKNAARKRKPQTRDALRETKTSSEQRNYSGRMSGRNTGANADSLIRPSSQRVFAEEQLAQSTTVGERRRSIQREKRAQLSRSISRRVLIAAASVVVLVTIALIIYQSNFLEITELKVEGSAHLTSSHLTEVAAVPAESTLLRVDVDGITARLEADPWIEHATIERQFPNILILRIEERLIAAQAEIIPDAANGQITHWLVSEDGFWLGTQEGSEQTASISNSEISGLAMIKDVSRAVRPALGDKIDDEGVLNALAILQGFSSEMRGMVASISAPDRTRTTLNLLNNVGVAFGAAEDIAAKESAIKTLLNAHAGTITYINVRVPDRATYRAVE